MGIKQGRPDATLVSQLIMYYDILRFTVWSFGLLTGVCAQPGCPHCCNRARSACSVLRQTDLADTLSDTPGHLSRTCGVYFGLIVVGPRK